MKAIRTILVTGLLTLTLPFTPVMAEPAIQIAGPVIELVPIVKAKADELKLSADQKAKLEAWMADAPAKRKAIEQEQVELRMKLRQATLSLNADAT